MIAFSKDQKIRAKRDILHTITKGKTYTCIACIDDYVYITGDNGADVYVADDNFEADSSSSSSYTNNYYHDYTGYWGEQLPLDNLQDPQFHQHKWKKYFGLNNKFQFCEICDEKRDYEA